MVAKATEVCWLRKGREVAGGAVLVEDGSGGSCSGWMRACLLSLLLSLCGMGEESREVQEHLHWAVRRVWTFAAAVAAAAYVLRARS